jgi:hypothetical protein
MTIKKLLLCVAAFWAVWSLAPADEAPSASGKKDYTALSRLLHKIVVSQLPEVFQDDTGWGRTIPLPERLRLMRLRKVILVNGQPEVPHGNWRKVRVKLDDPNRDLKIQVRDLHPVDKSTYHLTVEVEAALRAALEMQQWQKGLLLLNVAGQADARVGMILDCDVVLSLKSAGLAPEVKVEPRLTGLKLELKDFDLRQVEARRLGAVLEGEALREVGNDYRGVLQDLLRAAEPSVKEYANQAIAHSLREGKGTFSAAALLKALAPKTQQ